MGALPFRLRSHVAGLFVIALALSLTSGCGGGPDEEHLDRELQDLDTTETDASADSSARTDSLARVLAAQYLSYSYQGASLRSTHPLNDSLFALKAGAESSGPVVLVDTFRIAPDAVTQRDSAHVVRIEVPHALQVSRSWQLSPPSASPPFTVRIRKGKVAQAPRLVGWPALQRHIRRAEPGRGDAIIERLRREWTDTTGTRPAV